MKKLLVLFAFSVAATGAFAHPGWGCPPPHYYHNYGCGDFWGRGGCNFWPGFIGGLVGGVAASALTSPRQSTVVTQPAVVTQPVVIQQQPVVIQQQPLPTVVSQPATVVAAPVTQIQNVWVEGRYVDQVQPNGSVIRTWSPGHYEQRTVTVQ